ncbi:hypothetical protein JCM5805K_1290 [Lactococcus lactis subsp. lactis]|uniref:Uncharacterized protein n=1 Tax=Lactococcus lactis subsp. lactis TaxID=1360 RepID=A0A0B8R1P2_LACLL|nr:hypothetical protein JCM5805K_1290 [Lactococcus lactis subsp. lactis]
MTGIFVFLLTESSVLLTRIFKMSVSKIICQNQLDV